MRLQLGLGHRIHSGSFREVVGMGGRFILEVRTSRHDDATPFSWGFDVFVFCGRWAVCFRLTRCRSIVFCIMHTPRRFTHSCSSSSGLGIAHGVTVCFCFVYRLIKSAACPDRNRLSHLCSSMPYMVSLFLLVNRSKRCLKVDCSSTSDLT